MYVEQFLNFLNVLNRIASQRRFWARTGEPELVRQPVWASMLASLLLLPLLFSPSGAGAVALDPNKTRLCYDAIAQASRQMNVPTNVMLAISLTETGKKIAGRVSPWPWTVNMEGKGVWFKNRHEALAYVKQHYKRGARSFDVGCFQINYKWHHQHFRSIEDMFDPDINAAYAARFLVELFQETGSWSLAAGHYHSRTPEYANRYRERFNRYLARLSTDGVAPPVYQGHGSEALRVAEARVQSGPTREYAPLLQLGRRDPLFSSRKSAQGSLFIQKTESGGLLRRTSSSLF